MNDLCNDIKNMNTIYPLFECLNQSRNSLKLFQNDIDKFMRIHLNVVFAQMIYRDGILRYNNLNPATDYVFNVIAVLKKNEYIKSQNKAQIKQLFDNIIRDNYVSFFFNLHFCTY